MNFSGGSRSDRLSKNQWQNAICDRSFSFLRISFSFYETVEIFDAIGQNLLNLGENLVKPIESLAGSISAVIMKNLIIIMHSHQSGGQPVEEHLLGFPILREIYVYLYSKLSWQITNYLTLYEKKSWKIKKLWKKLSFTKLLFMRGSFYFQCISK